MIWLWKTRANCRGMRIALPSPRLGLMGSLLTDGFEFSEKCSMTRRIAAAILACVLTFGLVPGAALAGFKEGREAYDRKDFPTAWKELEPLAKQGNADAMYLIGSMHHMGMGTAPSYKDAAEWYRKSADAGKIDAIFTMGVVYEGGIG